MNDIKITDVALAALKEKNPSIKYENESLSAHDVIHIIGHPSFDGDLNKTIPMLRTSIHDELLVLITQYVLIKGEIDISEMRKELGNNYIQLYNQVEYKRLSSESKAKEQNNPDEYVYDNTKKEELREYTKNLTEKNENGTLDVGITDQAIEYYMVRAQLIRQQLEKAGELDKLQDERINEIDPKLLAVSKEAVIQSLEEKHGGHFSIKTEIPKNNIISSSVLHQANASQQHINQR